MQPQGQKSVSHLMHQGADFCLTGLAPAAPSGPADVFCNRTRLLQLNPAVAGRFVSAVINIYNQATVVPEDPAKTPHTESDGETEHLARPTSSVPDTELILNHIIPAETAIKRAIGDLDMRPLGLDTVDLNNFLERMFNNLNQVPIFS